MRFGPRLQAGDVVEIHGEYEAGSTLGFYLRRQVRILDGRSSDLWYGSFFSDAPQIFDDDASFQPLWSGPQRIFLWTPVDQVPALPGPAYVIAQSGGKKSLAIGSRPRSKSLGYAEAPWLAIELKLQIPSLASLRSG